MHTFTYIYICVYNLFSLLFCFWSPISSTTCANSRTCPQLLPLFLRRSVLTFIIFLIFPVPFAPSFVCHNSLYYSRQQTLKSTTIAAISTVQHSPLRMPRRSPLLLHPLPFLSPSFKCVQLCVYARCEAPFFFWTEACSRALFFLCQRASSVYVCVYIHDTRSPPTTRGLLSRFYLGCPASICSYVCMHGWLILSFSFLF